MTERLIRLQALIAEQQADFNMRTVDMVVPVLLDGRGNREGQLHGRTPYMQAVHVQASERLFGEIVNVRINAAFTNSISGEVVTNETILRAA